MLVSVYFSNLEIVSCLRGEDIACVGRCGKQLLRIHEQQMNGSGCISDDGIGKIDARNPNSGTDRNQRVGIKNHVSHVMWIDAFFRRTPDM